MGTFEEHARTVVQGSYEGFYKLHGSPLRIATIRAMGLYDWTHVYGNLHYNAPSNHRTLRNVGLPHSAYPTHREKSDCKMCCWMTVKTLAFRGGAGGGGGGPFTSYP